MEPLTARQQQVLDLIHAHVTEHGVPPTRAEIATALGLRSPNTAEFHLKALARKGYIEMPAGRSRNLRLQAAPPAVLPAGSGGLPLVGRVAAGAPMLAAQHIEGYYRCEELFRPQPDYLLRVKGMSMRDAGILEGDLLAVKRSPEAQNGQIVVARLDDEVTVKRLEQRHHRIRLLPENPDFDPIEVDSWCSNGIALVIEGIVVGVIRSGRL